MKRNKILWLKKCKKALVWVWNNFPFPNQFGACGNNVVLLYPLHIVSPQSVYIEDNVKLTNGLSIINAPTEKVIIKKYTEFAANCTIVTNNHRSTVGVPQFILGASHVNDKSGDVVIEEDVWLGAGATILAGVRLGRGCIIGANSLVTKDVPPYAVVAGSPAKIIKKKFNNTQIINHEKTLYSKDERLTPKQLEELDQVYFKGMTTFGTDGISEDDRRIIENTKRKLRFVEPKIL